ncbi:MAG: RNA repair domain-containing protein [Candidatus Woesearchaeota archaeon]
MSIKSIFTIRESDKHFLLALIAVTGVVFFWRGLWGVLDITPILSNFFVSLAIGLAIMTFSGIIYREFMPEEEPLTPVIDIIKDIFKSPIEERKQCIIEYYDSLMKAHKKIAHTIIKKLEHDYAVIEQKGEEFFIPIHRIHRIQKNGKILFERKGEKKSLK